ncbi:MAG: FG-GAP repeat protein, partial [Verrucomicrobia bacterium]|nr:FG-GAP repeat protein [Verrucomicrobiota bacterium]
MLAIALLGVLEAADPPGQTAFLKAGNADPRDRFGAALAVSGDLLVVGAPGEGSRATGVNGDSVDDSLFAAGAVYVFTRSGDAWIQEAYLKASDTHQRDEFGAAVAFSGDTLVVGAPGWSTNGNGVASGPGAAYVFVRRDGAWVQQAMLQAANAGQSDEFGAAVAVDGDTVVIGARSEDGGAVGVNGDGSDNGIPQAGAAYVFVRGEGRWIQQAYLKASNNRRGPFGAGGEFGYSVAVY